MTRSLSGGVLAGTDEPLMVGLALLMSSYLEQSNLWGGSTCSFARSTRLNVCPETAALAPSILPFFRSGEAAAASSKSVYIQHDRICARGPPCENTVVAIRLGLRHPPFDVGWGQAP
jgi:hypothetical protein